MALGIRRGNSWFQDLGLKLQVGFDGLNNFGARTKKASVPSNQSKQTPSSCALLQQNHHILTLSKDIIFLLPSDWKIDVYIRLKLGLIFKLALELLRESGVHARCLDMDGEGFGLDAMSSNWYSPSFSLLPTTYNSVLGGSTKMPSRRPHQAAISSHGNEHQSQLMPRVFKARKYGRKSA